MQALPAETPPSRSMRRSVLMTRRASAAIDVCSRKLKGRTPSRLRVARKARRSAALIVAWLTAAFAVAGLAQAAQPGVTQVSSDPYTPATAPTGQHATEVEPDTFAWGSTVVTA